MFECLACFRVAFYIATNVKWLHALSGKKKENNTSNKLKSRYLIDLDCFLKADKNYFTLLVVICFYKQLNTEALLITGLVYRTCCPSHAEHRRLEVFDPGYKSAAVSTAT